MLDRGMAVFDGPDGEFSGFIGTCIDITDRKRAETELSRRAEEFHALADNISQLCWMAYADGFIYWYNRRWYDYTGAAPETQPGWGWEAVHDPSVLPLVKERWLQSLRTGEPFEMTFPIKRADGHFADFLTRAVPIRDGSGVIVRWFGTNTDVSAQLATERELRELTSTLEQRVEAAIRERQAAMEQLAHAQKLESIGHLTSGVAHDFNNLLTPIIGALDVLGRRVSDSRSQQLASLGLQSAERARTLVERLLAFARKQHLQAQAVDIKAILDGMSDMLTRTLGPRIDMHIDVLPALPPAHVDPSQLELAILNLSLNARDAMADGGTLTIAARKATIDLHPRLTRGDYVCISVADTGRGMDELTLQRAVEPFFTTKPTGHGTGLGLSMVHGLAAQSHGDLLLESAPGVGTTATIWLPVSHDLVDRSSAQQDEAEAVRENERITILLVDDEAVVRMGTAIMLSSLGYRVLEAASGKQALALFDEGVNVHIVITDYAMPEMTGEELAAAFRQRHPELPILIITGFASLQDRQASDLPRLSKPFRCAELEQKVAELLERSGVKPVHAHEDI
jgi:PAS domain S-box-containing protein